MKVYVHWSEVPGSRCYYIYRFQGTLEEALQRLDEFNQPRCFNERRALTSYVGTTPPGVEFVAAVCGDPPKTYYVDDVLPGVYYYYVRAADDYCVGPVSDPIPVTASDDCEDPITRYDTFVFEGHFYDRPEYFTRKYGYSVRIKNIRISPYGVTPESSEQKILIYIYDSDDADNGVYVCVDGTTEQPINLDVRSGILIVSSVPVADWQTLYDSGVVECEPPSGYVDVLNLNVQVEVQITDKNLYEGLPPIRYYDMRHHEGSVVPRDRIFSGIYPFDADVEEVYISFQRPPTVPLTIDINGSEHTIEPGTRHARIYPDIDLPIGTELSIIANDPVGVTSTSDSLGASMDIRVTLVTNGQIDLCPPYECISYQTDWIEGALINGVSSEYQINESGKIVRIFVHSAYKNNSDVPATVEIRNKRSGESATVVIQPGMNWGYVCADLDVQTDDILQVIGNETTEDLVNVNVIYEVWTCGFGGETCGCNKVSGACINVDGCKYEGGVVSPNQRYRLYSTPVRITNVQVYKYQTEPITVRFVGSVHSYELTTSAGDYFYTANTDWYFDAFEEIRVILEGVNTSATLTWFFTTPEGSVAPGTLLDIVNMALEGASINEVIGRIICIEPAIISLVNIHSRYPATSDTSILVVNVTSGEQAEVLIPEGANSVNTPIWIPVMPGDEVLVRRTYPGALTSVNVSLHLNKIADGSCRYAYVWYFLEGGMEEGVAITDTIPVNVNRIGLVTVQVNHEHGELVFEITNSGVSKYVTIPPGVANHNTYLNMPVVPGSELTIRNLTPADGVSVDFHMEFIKVNT